MPLTKQDRLEYADRLKRMITNGHLRALRVPNVGKTASGVNACWYILWVFEDKGRTVVQDRTQEVAKALGYRVSQKHYWLIARAFSLSGQDITNDIQTLTGLDDFKLEVIQ